MEGNLKYDNYPFWIIALSNTVSLLIYGLGFIIMFRLGWAVSFLYLFYIIILDYRLLKNHCTNCYYWGKNCGFGKGRLSSCFFKKGDISKFCSNEMTWKDMVPDLLISLIPFLAGIVLVIIKFDYVLLIVMILLMLLSTTGNGFIRGNLTCRYCKQKGLGCPADKLFNKQ
jgi:hypothetical protein